MPTIIPIDDADDPRIAAYTNIRERDLVGREGLFVAEGKVVLHVLLARSRHEPLSIFLAEKRVAGLMPLLAGVRESIPIYTAPQAIMDRIAGFPMHRGMLALGRRAASEPAEQFLAGMSPRAMVLCLLGIANHDNVGGIFRNAAAFAADGVILDQASCDPLYRKAIRVSVGGTLMVPFARLAPGDDILDLLGRHGFDVLALSPHGAHRLDEIGRGQRIAVLLGSEGAGLSADILARATAIAIPIAVDFDSLNVATTSGIVLHHIRNQSSEIRTQNSETAATGLSDH